jgi:hypothetical protein
MFGCYLDESFDKKGSGFYSVGGFICRGVAAFELERNWDECLERHGLDYYKAYECESGTKQFLKFIADPADITDAERKKLDSISHEFCHIIGFPVEYDTNNYLSLFGNGVVQSDFYEIIKDDYARSVLGESPFRLAYDLAMVQAAWAMKQFCDRYCEGQVPAHCVSYVCDEDEEHAEIAPISYRALREANPIAAQYMCTFSTADEKKCVPVQVADAVVYEIRKVLKFHKRDWETKLRAQFGIFADARIMFYVGHTEREQLDWIVANHKPGEPFKVDELMKMEMKENVDKLRVREI